MIVYSAMYTNSNGNMYGKNKVFALAILWAIVFNDNDLGTDEGSSLVRLMEVVGSSNPSLSSASSDDLPLS